jgi:ABC-2 type transport system ATP-binding protein
MANPLLDIRNVHKRYATVHAVAGVSLQLHPGEIFALLGPNGAGKTTLIRMLLGLTRPDSGSIAYDLGGGPVAAPGAPELGYLPEDRGLYPDMPVLKTLAYFGVLRGMQRKAAAVAAERWLERMSLLDRKNEPLKSLSKGNQQKVQFISSILHAPRFAVLDEPFSGLDPINQDFFLELIRDLRGSGTTVLLSAHQMQLVERIADRIVVMNRGVSVLSGTLSEIRRRWTTGSRLLLRVEGEPDLGFLAGHGDAVRSELRPAGEIEVFVRDGHPLSAVLADLGRCLDVREVHSYPVTLHDVYVRTVTGDTGDTSGAAVAEEVAT